MISSIKERKVRRGHDECIFFDGEYSSCTLYDIGGCESNCNSNFSQKEMQLLIDQHNSKELSKVVDECGNCRHKKSRNKLHCVVYCPKYKSTKRDSE